MRVTVFGGTGFVGGYLIDALLANGHHPVLLVRPARPGSLIAPGNSQSGQHRDRQ
jgi:NADH dehydrogenase